MILEDEGSGGARETDMHGEEWSWRKYIVEVRPAGEEPFRIETKKKVPIWSHPGRGDVVKVSYDPKNQKTEIHIEGDPRYDPKLIRENKKTERAARADALLSGAPVPAPASLGIVFDDVPQWTVPATCPECGARVDQSKAAMAEHPTCTYCAQPLPCQPTLDHHRQPRSPRRAC